ncbi:hypothetical protein AMAG_06513 [Allomyces macrogynus ATCC 38327]|uniref:SET domain-containing protein n=1 Tax=Allomyces macrogynus (strain ATCC 38327) TaxID=578462 RepID=A0A0L0SGS1_ALLM3|nr:hypothetical protein AMAG_06513 [Allomyces macrogynus ATCC 38327]|eukprot:KNE61711.1 hypothetical protein AMAG_06513 [Allomyces macrogynus ATCC 38327]
MPPSPRRHAPVRRIEHEHTLCLDFLATLRARTAVPPPRPRPVSPPPPVVVPAAPPAPVPVPPETASPPVPLPPATMPPPHSTSASKPARATTLIVIPSSDSEDELPVRPPPPPSAVNNVDVVQPAPAPTPVSPTGPSRRTAARILPQKRRHPSPSPLLPTPTPTPPQVPPASAPPVPILDDFDEPGDVVVLAPRAPRTAARLAKHARHEPAHLPPRAQFPTSKLPSRPASQPNARLPAPKPPAAAVQPLPPAVQPPTTPPQARARLPGSTATAAANGAKGVAAGENGTGANGTPAVSRMNRTPVKQAWRPFGDDHTERHTIDSFRAEIAKETATTIAIDLTGVTPECLPPKSWTYVTDLTFAPGADAPDPAFLAGCDCDGKCRLSFNGVVPCECVALLDELTDGKLRGARSLLAPYKASGQLRVLPKAAHEMVELIECNPNCMCDMATCPLRVVQRGPVSIQVGLKFMPRKGWGVYATAPIPPGTFVAQYIGEVLHVTAVRNSAYLFDLDYFTREGHQYMIDAAQKGNFARFLNHSCSPNLAQAIVLYDSHNLDFHRVAFFTRRDIARGEELTFDYTGGVPDQDAGAVANGAGDAPVFFKCECGAEGCRGMVN